MSKNKTKKLCSKCENNGLFIYPCTKNNVDICDGCYFYEPNLMTRIINYIKKIQKHLKSKRLL